MLFSAVGLTSCQNDMDEMGGKEVTLKVTAQRGEALTRTTLEEDGEGNLACKWNEGDQLLVINNASGKKIGVITLKSGAGTNNGVFEGKVDLTGQSNVSLVYLGSATEAEPYASDVNNIALNVSEQDGTLASLTSKDVLTAEAAVKDIYYVKNEATAEVTMTRQMAHGYFSLDFSEAGNLTLEEGDVITITGDGLRSEGKVNFKNGGSVPTTATYTGSTTITITKKEAGNDFYLTMLPVGSVTPTFTVVKDGETYTSTLTAHNWVSGEFVRKNDKGEAVSLKMEKEASVPEDPNSPGDLSNWGASNSAIAAVATPLSPKFVSETGWTNNIRNLYNMGGYCTAVEITNGMQNGLLTSQGGYYYFFQWGRFLGFPSNVAGTSMNIPGASNLDYFVGYLGSSGVPVKYTAAYMGNSSDYNKQRALDWSIVFGQTNNNYLDYIYNNANNGSWYDRCPNPAPTGYRIPTMAELSFFIPSVEEVNGSYAEVKDVNGVKYAVKWVVGKSGTTGYVDVTSVKTKETSVTVNSSVFESADAKTVRIAAYGYLQNNGKQAGSGEIGFYWSSESGTQNAIDGVSGKGGRAMYIEVSGTKAILCELCPPFGFGGNVLLIKDPEATANKIKPWLPYSYDFTAIK